jgi:5,10-methylenetetrahydromethanopterin reductase
MRIGIGIHGPGETQDIDEFRQIVRLADKYGVSHMASGDSVSHEGFTTATMMAADSESARIGLTMVNPITRLPGTVAAGLASLNYISKRRAYLILARGDGAVRNAGYTPAKVETARAYFLAVREALETGATVYKGRRIVLRPPLKEWGPGIPLGFVAEGPRMLRLAGELGDVIQVGTGLTREVIEDSLARIQEGAEAAGRTLSDIDIWWSTRFRLARTEQAAMEHQLVSLASMGNHALRDGYAEKRVPVELHERLARYHQGFDYTVKGVRGGPNVKLMEELGLTSYFRERFGVFGGPEEVAERIRQLEALGIRHLHVGIRRVEDMELLGAEVMPAVI